MDQKLKERLVGAAVVVALGVIFIPALLDGPAPPGIETRDLDLSAQDGVSVKTVTIDLGKPAGRAPQPDPIVTEVQPPPMDTPEPAAGQEPVQPDSRPTPDVQSASPAAQEAEPAAPATGGWAVQVGSFSSSENADRLSRQLAAQGYETFVSRYRDGARNLYRVRVGPVPSREAAETLATRLSEGGQKGRVVPNS